MRLFEPGHAKPLSDLKPGDLSASQGEWLFPTGPGGAEGFIRQALLNHAEGRELWVGIWRGNRLVGALALRDIQKSRATASLDYALDAEWRGKGVMTDACEAMLAHAFGALGLDRIESVPDVANAASCAVLERLGFAREGILKNAYQSASGWRDVARYALLQRDWRARTEGAGARN